MGERLVVFKLLAMPEVYSPKAGRLVGGRKIQPLGAVKLDRDLPVASKKQRKR